jgi:hypothetical protein
MSHSPSCDDLQSRPAEVPATEQRYSTANEINILRVKRPGCEADHSHTSITELKIVEIHLHSLNGVVFN